MSTKNVTYSEILVRGCLIFILLAIPLNAQIENWIYTYEGSGNVPEHAHCIIYCEDGNIYAAGNLYGNDTTMYFGVVSLTSSGGERWVYTYDETAHEGDCVHALTWGQNGSIYAAGRSKDTLTDYDITVISLTSSGDEKWVYRYNGPGNGWDEAHSIVYGLDGNIYVAGSAQGANRDFTVVSIDTLGNQRWVYRYNGPGNGGDYASSLTYGSDGNIYATGSSAGDGTDGDLIIISLYPSGVERWVYRYDGPAHAYDGGNDIVFGEDSNLYIAGRCYHDNILDFTVISLTTSGNERWSYTVNTYSHANVLVCGSDGNIYAGGRISSKLAIVSLTDLGVERWIYTCNWGIAGESFSLIYGGDEVIYSSGGISSGVNEDYTVVSVGTAGQENWTYTYNGTGDRGDRARSVCYGLDGILYTAGSAYNESTNADFTVISIDPETGLNEALSQKHHACFQVGPNPFKSEISLKYNLSKTSNAAIIIYNILGEEIKTLVEEKQSKGTHNIVWNCLDNNDNKVPSGVYFLKFEADDFTSTEKLVLLR